MNMKWKLDLEKFSDHKIFEFLECYLLLVSHLCFHWTSTWCLHLRHQSSRSQYSFFSYISSTALIRWFLKQIKSLGLFVYSLSYRLCVFMEIKQCFDYFKELFRRMSIFLSLESKSEVVTFDLQGSQKASSAMSMTHCLH